MAFDYEILPVRNAENARKALDKAVKNGFREEDVRTVDNGYAIPVKEIDDDEPNTNLENRDGVATQGTGQTGSNAEAYVANEGQDEDSLSASAGDDAGHTLFDSEVDDSLHQDTEETPKPKTTRARKAAADKDNEDN